MEEKEGECGRAHRRTSDPRINNQRRDDDQVQSPHNVTSIPPPTPPPPLLSSNNPEAAPSTDNFAPEPCGRDGATTSTELSVINRDTSPELPAGDVSTAVPPQRRLPETAIACDHQLQIPWCMNDEPTQTLLNTAAPRPPVTTLTLAELDLKWISNNITLRVDINYDHDLHFMPVSGQRGEEKKENAKRFWEAITVELRVYQHNCAPFCRQCDKSRAPEPAYFEQRLPIMFDDLRELLKTLVPDRDQDQVTENLDVSLLLQEVKHGVLDVVRLSKWLTALLTSHCAPMRDEWAREMAEKIEEGAVRGNTPSLVAGLETLFSFLEAMKLDVANHQIRTFRYPLIEDTVSFQQDYFSGRIANKSLDVTESKKWFARISHKPDVPAFSSFVNGLVMLCTVPNEAIPLTLKHDTNRLVQIQDEIQDKVHLKICLAAFDELVQNLVGLHCDPSSMHGTLQHRIMDLSEADNEVGQSVPDIWHAHIDPIALEITRAAYALCRRLGRPVSAQNFALTARKLKWAFEDEREGRLQAFDLARELKQEILRHTNAFQHMSAWTISDAQRQWQKLRQQRVQWRNIPDIEDMARRLAHMAVIHWRVWANMVYVDQDEEPACGVGGHFREASASGGLTALDDILCEQMEFQEGSERSG